MNGCTLSNFDLGQCITNTLFGWLMPYWSYFYWGFWLILALLLLGALYRVKMVFGTPGLVAVWSGIVLVAGFILGQKSTVRVTPNEAGQPTVKFPGHPAPVVVQKPQHVKTIFDDLKSLSGS